MGPPKMLSTLATSTNADVLEDVMTAFHAESIPSGPRAGRTDTTVRMVRNPKKDTTTVTGVSRPCLILGTPSPHSSPPYVTGRENYSAWVHRPRRIPSGPENTANTCSIKETYARLNPQPMFLGAVRPGYAWRRSSAIHLPTPTRPRRCDSQPRLRLHPLPSPDGRRDVANAVEKENLSSDEISQIRTRTS